MDKFREWIISHLPTQRRLIQLYTALLYNAHVKGFIKGDIFIGRSKMLCVPGLNCYSCPGAVGACPLGALQNAVASSGNRAPFYVMGILLLYSMIFGRSICGFLCPMGLLQELLHKLPTPKLGKGRTTRALSYLKYVLLMLLVILIPLWSSLKKLPLPAFCKYVCPAGTLEGAVGLLANPVNSGKFSMLGALFTQKFLLLLLITACCIFVYRAFCRFLCPLGAIYGMFNRYVLVGVKVDITKCIDCGRCVQQCKMDVRCVPDHECIHCGECIDGCPTKAISIKAGRITLQGYNAAASPKHTRKKKRILWYAAIVFLTALLAIVNLPDHAMDVTQVQIRENQLEQNDLIIPSEHIGYQVGEYAPDFVAPLYNTDGSFQLSDYRGKKVVVNFWATWCAPCCTELPYFDAIYRAYGEQVTVVAVHSNLITDDVENYLSAYDYSMLFAQDETGEIISSFGGSTMLPHTVILDEMGQVIYNATGSMTYEELEGLLNVR